MTSQISEQLQWNLFLDCTSLFLLFFLAGQLPAIAEEVFPSQARLLPIVWRGNGQRAINEIVQGYQSQFRIHRAAQELLKYVGFVEMLRLLTLQRPIGR